MPEMGRFPWAKQTLDQLAHECEVDTYRASGPGGQKRNKTSSAVRFRHLPTGLIIIAEESRSQHQNRAKAAERVWQALYLYRREPVLEAWRCTNGLRAVEELAELPDVGAIHLSHRHPLFWPLMGRILDGLVQTEGQVSTLADWLGVSTGNLIDLLEIDAKVWQEANNIRLRFGKKQLKQSS